MRATRAMLAIVLAFVLGATLTLTHADAPSTPPLTYKVIIGPVSTGLLPPTPVAGPLVLDAHPSPASGAQAPAPAVDCGDEVAPCTVYLWLEAAGWPKELWHQAAKVAKCESGWTPTSRNGAVILGLFQLWDGWFAYAGIDVSYWADPVLNARVALAVYQYDIARGYAPWTQWTCKP